MLLLVPHVRLLLANVGLLTLLLPLPLLLPLQTKKGRVPQVRRAPFARITWEISAVQSTALVVAPLPLQTKKRSRSRASHTFSLFTS